MSQTIPNQDMLEQAQADKFARTDDLGKFLVQEIEDNFKYRNVKQPFQKLETKSGCDVLSLSQFHHDFTAAYANANLKHFVHLDQFRENSRQWLLAYDPFKADQMLQIYGRKQPQSFLIR